MDTLHALTLGQTLLAEVNQFTVAAVAVGGGMCVAIAGIVAYYTAETAKSKHRQETARDVAAFVAEGTMKPEEAERILNAAGAKDTKA